MNTEPLGTSPDGVIGRTEKAGVERLTAHVVYDDSHHFCLNAPFDVAEFRLATIAWLEPADLKLVPQLTAHPREWMAFWIQRSINAHANYVRLYTRTRAVLAGSLPDGATR